MIIHFLNLFPLKFFFVSGLRFNIYFNIGSVPERKKSPSFNKGNIFVGENFTISFFTKEEMFSKYSSFISLSKLFESKINI